MRGVLGVVVVAGAVLVAPVGGMAQQAIPVEAKPRTLQEDSLAALRALDRAVRTNQHDAAAWHERGVVAWRMSGAEKRTGYMKRLANDSLLQLADSSLSLAVSYAPNTPRYLIDLARFYLTSNSAAVRGRAHGLFKRALGLARTQHDSMAASDAADGLGMEQWRSYETQANRNVYSTIIKSFKDRSFLSDPRSIAYYVSTMDLRAAAQEWSGQSEYLKAFEYFAQATQADPDNITARRHIYMSLAERRRWVELQHDARTRLTVRPREAWSWAVLGIASHRLGDDDVAAAAFDSAFTYFTPDEREQYDRLSRIMKPRDADADEHLPAPQQRLASRLYWLMADPLWLTPDNVHRLEYLSRVLYAELCFSVPEFAIHGADTDRGEVYVRYGPPPEIISFPPDPAKQATQHIRELWWYSADEAFLFELLPGYGVVTLDPYDAGELARLRDTVPVVWRNVGGEENIDSIAVQMALFRGPPDSADVFVAAQLPMADLTHGIDLSTGSLEMNFEGFDWSATRVFQKLSHEVIDLAHQAPSEIRQWRTRVPTGTYMVRVEALEPDAMRGARAADRMDIGSGLGFGMSDVLVADTVEPKPGAEPTRWSDFTIAPGFGRVRRGHPISLLWETYALGTQKQSNRYRVAITLHRVGGSSGLAGLVAKIVGGVKSAIGLSSRGSEAVSLAYPRETPARPVAVDYVTLDLGSAPPGPYLLTVDVTDLVNHVHTQRQTAITITK
ncbi:MAG TPA: GWxTD domain-containing protein [Gemmatimonadaceae bacterium]